MEKKVKFGIVGVGSRGLQAFSTMICKRSDAEISAFCDTNALRMKCAAEKLNITPNFYSTITDMVKNESLDAVVITTPDFYHEECAIEALQNGVNVLIDKPLATSVKGCRNIIAAAEKAGKTVMLGFNLRHNAVLKKVKKLISENTIGKVFLIENREFYDGGRTYMARWNRSYEFCGGLWIHKGSHDFDVFQWLLDFPKPVKVSSFAGINILNEDHIPFELTPGVPTGPTCHECPYKKICPDIYDISDELDRWGDEAAKLDGYKKDLCIYTSDKSVHDNGIAMVEYDNGARASHMECFVTPISDRRYTIVGELGQIEASLTDRIVTLRPRWSKEIVTYQIPNEEGGHGGADPNLLDTFIKVITGELANTSTTEHGMMSTAVGEAAELSRRQNRTVFIEELFRD
ncbi:MAG: Gfo/Idh/MocA family oxidoreductase [Lentisphaeria bacterium]|nr:Gfo/Idh/MocA family oxidoreductase [Lentisphaeria bacterium]